MLLTPLFCNIPSGTEVTFSPKVTEEMPEQPLKAGVTAEKAALNGVVAETAFHTIVLSPIQFAKAASPTLLTP